jgi:hypothetical protein
MAVLPGASGLREHSQNREQRGDSSEDLRT